MGLARQMLFLMGILTTAIVLAAQVSTGSDAFSSPAILSAIPPIIGTIGSQINAPTPSASQQNGSSPQSPTVFPPSIEPSSPTFLPQPPVPIREPGPAFPPSSRQEKEPITMNPTYPPATVESPSHVFPQFPPNIQPDKPGSRIISPAPAPAPTNGVNNPPSMRPVLPGAPQSIFPVPFMSPPTISPVTDPLQSPFKPPVPKVPATSTPPPTINGKIYGTPIDASPAINPFPPKSAAAPSSHKMTRHSKSATNLESSPKSSPEMGYHSPASSPNISSLTPRYVRRNKTNQAQSPSTLPPSDKRAPLYPPKSHPGSAEGLHAPLQDRSDSSIPPSFSSRPSSSAHISHSQAPTIPSGKETMLHHSPKFSPSGSSPSSPRIPLPYHGLPPPPPNEECSSISCMEPLTYPVHGSPCVCVVPMQVGLRITVALYTFFPSVAEISDEIASGIFMRQSQVRIMGANADSQDEEKTVVLIDLVPLEEKFDNTTAFLTYMRFWNKQIVLKSSLFGDYEVLYVHYPGLPASPPPSSGIINSVPNNGNGNNGRTIQPLGVDVSGQKHHKQGLSSSIITIIVLSAFLFLVLCSLFAWIFVFKDRENREDPTPIASLLSVSKPSGIDASLMGSMRSSASMSCGSSLAIYNGSSKGFSLIDIERATDNFNNSRILGEGGFGRVYSGVLEDGSKVAVKVLKRDDQQGGREFLAEVEMLSRLHHRNLVKLFGICTEENARCLVYELIPNGSLESHLHGVDKEASPLDWGARMKIALGAARGLAYLHEDSSPHVIHRDFKSSNILLEHDFTPKVSDFGLARAAIDEQDAHISTRVMGTFGYVAPEYAMTGHLLVKSDVYSYGVVLLELLTGRKPVDMSQPPGQENLVAWARPMLTTREGFQSIIDPFLGPDFPLDSIAKVVAIASMCVQPEVSNRPFMGEVVQALKLICNEREDDPSEDAESIEMDAARSSSNSDLYFNHLQHCHSPDSNYCSGLDAERGFTVSDSFDNSVRLGRQNTRALRVFSNSGPLRLGRRKRERLWQKLKKLSGGTTSEHGTVSRMWPPGSH